jgi:hypothetical protein
MFRHIRQVTAIVFLGILSGCAYDRGAGWHWDGGAIGDGVIESISSLIPDNRSASEQAEADSNEFFNR